MKKTAVIYWSGTGNTEAMANAVAEGMKEAGADVSVMTAKLFSSKFKHVTKNSNFSTCCVR